MLELFFNFIEPYQDYFYWMAIVSAILFVVGVIATPLLLGLIDEDYFIQQKNYKFQINGFWHGVRIIARTLIGLILLIAGFIMLFTPGQGLLSIVIGLSMMEFPGKHRLEWKLIQHEPTYKALNWLRNKAGKAPFIR